MAQAALSVMLLVGAGLFVRSLRNAHAIDLGYQPSRMMVVQPNMRGERLKPVERAALTQRLLDRAEKRQDGLE